MWLSKRLAVFATLAMFPPALCAQPLPLPGRPVVHAVLDDQAITPVTAQFVARALAEARNRNAECIVITLDTPGGVLDSTRKVVKDLLSSDIPVIVFVAPSGARAASAGVFITMAAHVAAMAPGTNIGAAHPVAIGGIPMSPPKEPEERKQESGKSTPVEEKAVNDTVAWAKSLADLRGRNADWAARAVKESIAASAREALEAKVVDLIARDMKDLLEQIDGREVKLERTTVKLQTAKAEVETITMWWGEQVLAALANPTLAVLLLIFGFYGIFFELYSPGWGMPGTIGVICLALGLFAMAVLPINQIGLVLVFLALGLFAAEAFVISHGLLTLGGIICLILGGLMLVDSAAGFMRVSLWLLIPVAMATTAIAMILIGGVLKVIRLPSVKPLGFHATRAIALQDFVPHDGAHRGCVQIHGEIWNAVSAVPVRAGQKVDLERREGLTLSVCPVAEPVQPVAPTTPQPRSGAA